MLPWKYHLHRSFMEREKGAFTSFCSLASFWFKYHFLPGCCPTISSWERSQAAPTAATGAAVWSSWQANAPTLKLWPAAWEGNWMNLPHFVLFVNTAAISPGKSLLLYCLGASVCLIYCLTGLCTVQTIGCEVATFFPKTVRNFCSQSEKKHPRVRRMINFHSSTKSM